MDLTKSRRRWTNFTPETCPHRVLAMGVMNEIPVSSKEPKGGKAQFLQDSGSSSLDTPCTLVQDRKRLATLKSIQMTQKENCMNWQSKLRNCISYRSIHSWGGCLDFQTRELKKRGANMHFNADDSSVTMMMDLISPANDLRIVFGICDYLGKFSEIDVESRRNSASVVPYSKSRRTSLSLDLGLLQLKMSQVVLR